MAQAATAKRATTERTTDPADLLSPSDCSGHLAISEEALIGWAAAKLGCDPTKIEVGHREEQFDLSIRAPDPEWLRVPNRRRPSHGFRIRVIYEEATRVSDGRVTVMLHRPEWGATPAKGRHNMSKDVADEILVSRGWDTEASEPPGRKKRA